MVCSQALPYGTRFTPAHDGPAGGGAVEKASRNYLLAMTAQQRKTSRNLLARIASRLTSSLSFSSQSLTPSGNNRR